MPPGIADAPVERLREELAARPLRDAHCCPSWSAYVRELRARGAGALADALELALAPARSQEHRQERNAATRRALAELGGQGATELLRLWTGERAWSWWLGPFMLAFIDASPPSSAQLPGLLGPLGELLLPERVLAEEDALDWLLEQEPGSVVTCETSLVGQREALAGLLARANVALYAEQAVDEEALKWVWVQEFFGPEPTPPPSSAGHHAVLSPASAEALAQLHGPSVDALASAVVLGPAELLERRVPRAAPRVVGRVWPEPAARFVEREEQLAALHPGLVARLREELAARSIAEASTCPSWPVFIDLLLSEGHLPLAQWLRAAVEDPLAAEELGHTLTRSTFSGARPHTRYGLHALWKGRGLHAHWFGPFVLGYFDPRLDAELGALELQTLLGIHATFLARARVFTHVEADWIEQALRPRSRPLLAPVPVAKVSTIVAQLLVRARQPRRGPLELRGELRVAEPGAVLERRPERRELMTNVGPLAADNEATAVLCCEGPEDIERHAGAADHLGEFAHVIVLGAAELLARWPLAAERLAPWGA